MFLLVVLFIVVPIAELYVIIQVGQAIGVLPTLFLLLADAVLGSLLLRHQGRGAWRRFNEALAQRRFPGKEVVDGVLIVIGGTLLLAPGFITDIVGLFFLIPRPVRSPAASCAASPSAARRSSTSPAASEEEEARAPATAPPATTTSTPAPKRCQPTPPSASASYPASTTSDVGLSPL